MFFSRILPTMLIPNLSPANNKCEKKSFGVVLYDGSGISINGLLGIKETSSLDPFFFVTGHGALDISRRYARRLNARLAYLTSFGDAVRLFSELSFSVSENLFGAYASFSSGTPSYLSTLSAKNRTFLLEMKRCDIPQGIFMPYSDGEKIKKTGASPSDFHIAVKKLRADFGAKLSRYL